MRYMTLAGFGGFSLKTTGGRFAGFLSQNPGEDVKTTRGIIGKLASRRSILVKTPWLSDGRNSTWTIMPLRLSGSRKYLRAELKMCNSSINKRRGCPSQLSLPVVSFPSL